MGNKKTRDEALQILRENNIRRTSARVYMLEAMQTAEVPLDAKEIFDKVVEKVGEDSIWLSTIYRNLEVFEEKELVHQVRMPESESIYYHLHEQEHKHYAICKNCRKEIHLDFCYLDELSDSLESQGFTPKYHRLEIFGLCKDCNNKSK